MNLLLTTRILGALLLFLATTLLLPLPFSFYYNDGAWSSYVFSAIICLVVGGLMFGLSKSRAELQSVKGSPW